MIAAVFDVDRTLLPDTTAERLFLRFLIQERILGVRAAFETVRFFITHGQHDPVRAIRQHRPYLRGQQVLAMSELGELCFRQTILPRLSPRGMSVFRQHQEQGHRTVLLSGSLPFILAPMARYLESHNLICSELAHRDQRLSGRLIGLHPYGGAKALLVRRFACEQNLDLSQSYCYADHHSDASLLRLFGHPVCINPNDRLRRLAQRFDWRIEEF